MGGFPEEAPMYYRFDLTDQQWERIHSFFPDGFHHGQAGHPWKDHRPLVNGILWPLHTGAPWLDTPRRSWQTVYDRFNRWRKDGAWAKILDALLLQLDEKGLIASDLWCIEATVIRAYPAATGVGKKSGAAGGTGRASGDATPGARRPCPGVFPGRFRHQQAVTKPMLPGERHHATGGSK
jgi:transposase